MASMYDPMAGTPPNTHYTVNAAGQIEYQDLSQAFDRLIQRTPSILSLLKQGQRPEFGEDAKCYFYEGVDGYVTDTLNNGAPVANTDVTFKVTNISRFRVGMILQLQGALETMIVTNVNPATSYVTVTRQYNGITPPVSVADATLVRIIAQPQGEQTVPNVQSLIGLSKEYNYYQKFRSDILGSAMLANTRVMGYATPEAFFAAQMEMHSEILREDLAKSVLYNERIAPTGSVASTMRGIYTWLMQAGAKNVDKGGAALTYVHLNDMLASIAADNANINGNLLIYVHPTLSRKIATFNTSMPNRIANIDAKDNTAMGAAYVVEFIGDLAAVGRVKIFADPLANPNAVAILDMSRIKLLWAPNGQLRAWDSKTPTQEPDSVSRSMVMSATLEMRDHKLAHGLIYNVV